MTPKLPRPSWVAELFDKIDQLPSVLKLTAAVTHERQRAHRLEGQREMLMEKAKELHRDLAARDARIYELEHIIVNTLKQSLPKGKA